MADFVAEEGPHHRTNKLVVQTTRLRYSRTTTKPVMFRKNLFRVFCADAPRRAGAARLRVYPKTPFSVAADVRRLKLLRKIRRRAEVRASLRRLLRGFKQGLKNLQRPLAAACLLVSAGTLGAQTTSYTVQLLPGINSVANHLDHAGGNTLAQLFPVMPDGATLTKYDWSTQSFLPPSTYVAGVGWLPILPVLMALNPGEGAFLEVGTSFQVTFTGTPHPFQPRADVGPGYNFVSCQSLGPCSFEDVFGFEPRARDVVYLYDLPFSGGVTNVAGGASSIHTFTDSGWTTVPVFRQGRAAMVLLSGAPRITQQPVSQSVPIGSDAAFSVTAFGTPPLSYQWRFDGVLLAGRTNSSLALTKVLLSDAGPYSVMVSNRAGVITSAVAFLRVLVPPAIVEPPTNVTAKVGDRVNFRVVATGSLPLFYTWRHGNLLVTNAIQGLPVLTLSNVQPADAGFYTVSVSNVLGTVSSKEASLTVLQPPQIVVQPQGQVVDPGQTIRLSVTATGTPPLQYFWRLNGVIIPGETNATLTLQNIQPEESGNYSVTVQNGAGAVNSQDARVIVVVPPLELTDQFEDQLAIFEPSGIGRGSNVGATAQRDEPWHFGKLGGRSVWISWMVKGNGIATVRTMGSSFDTLLAAYTGDDLTSLKELASDDDRGGGFLGSEIRFNAIDGMVVHLVVDGFSGEEGDILLGWSLVPTSLALPEILVQPQNQLVTASNDATFAVQALGTRLEYVWFFNGRPVTDATGPILTIPNPRPADAGSYFVRIIQGNLFLDSRVALLEFSLSDPGTRPATNLVWDKFADAISSAGGLPQASWLAREMLHRSAAAPATLVSGYAGTQVFSTYGSVSQPGEPVHCGVVGGASQWFYYTAPASGTLFMNTEGSTFDTILAVYTGPGTSFSTLVPVACDNNSGADGLTSKLSFPATSGTTYYIAVDGVGGATGTVNLNYRLLIPMVLSRAALTNHTFRFRVEATPSYPFTVQVSTNLVGWSNVLSTSSVSGTFTFFESNAPSAPQHFYRTRQTP